MSRDSEDNEVLAETAKPMQLSEFVTNVLVQIAEGVEAARQRVVEKGCIVGGRGPRRIVEFDIAVITAQEGERTAGIGVFLAGVGIGGRRTSGGKHTLENRIRFGIPMGFERERSRVTLRELRDRAEKTPNASAGEPI